MNRTTRRYLRAIKRAIPLRDMRKRVVATMTATCEAFEQEQPTADRTAYYRRFGTPQQVAKMALENTGTDELYRGLTRARRIWRIALIVGILAVLGYGITYSYCLWAVKYSDPGHFSEEELYEVIE